MLGMLKPKCSVTIKQIMLTCWFTQRAESTGQSLGSIITTTYTTGHHKGVLLCSLTFTVSRVSVELEASLTQAQERAICVETLAPDAHIVFTAFIHI